VVTFTPLLWTSTPGGPALALRVQSSFAEVINRVDAGLGLSIRAPEGSEAISKLQGWLAVENPRLFGAARAARGVRAGAWILDGIARLEAGKTWGGGRFLDAPGARTAFSVGALGVVPYDRRWPDPARWSLGRTYELRTGYERRTATANPTLLRAELGGGYATEGRAFRRTIDAAADRAAGYARATVEARQLFTRDGGRQVTMVRGYAGASSGAPHERLIYVSSLDPVQTFENHFFRPRGGVLSGPDARYVSVGNGGLRAYGFALAGRSLASVNVEHAVRLWRFGSADRPFDLFADAFVDAGVLRDVPGRSLADDGGTGLMDAGVGIAGRGALFDRDLRFRVDFPVYVEQPALVVSARRNDAGQVIGARLSFSLTDLW
jgi:hypothetical protein